MLQIGRTESRRTCFHCFKSLRLGTLPVVAFPSELNKVRACICRSYLHRPIHIFIQKKAWKVLVSHCFHGFAKGEASGSHVLPFVFRAVV